MAARRPVCRKIGHPASTFTPWGTYTLGMEMEQEIVGDVLKRLARIEGQIAGIARMIEDGRDCEEVITQLSAASRALSRAGFKIVASGMRQCTRPGAGGPAPDVERMEKLFLSLA